jgi:TonB family protein
MDEREGWVIVSYIVSKNGEVVDAMVEDSSGSDAFERAALHGVEEWRFKPAMRNGVPVDQSMKQTRIVFRLDRGANGASDPFVRTYRRIQRLITEGKLAEAQPLIEALEIRERQNLYEDAWFWWLKFAYLDKAEPDDKADQIESLLKAVGYEVDYLPPDMFVAAAQRLYVLQVGALDLRGALDTFERLESSEAARKSEHYAVSVTALRENRDKIVAAAKGPLIIAMNARIGRHGYFVHDLLRRSFSILDVSGSIEVLDIRCDRRTVKYKAWSPGDVWSIPESWGECGAYVRGAPGTTFSFREHPATAPAQPLDVATAEPRG